MNKHLFSPSTKGARLLLLGHVLGLGVFLPVFAHAATFNVPNGDVAGLIAAINAANANPDADNVNLATGGTYTLTAVNNTGYFGPSGLPVIVSPITINGNGATIERSSDLATPDFRIFLVSNGVSQLTLNGLTIKGGQGGGGWAGAGILNTGNLLIRNSTVTKNVGVADDGGGILNYCGTLTITNSTISNNKSLSGYGGGGVLNFSSYCQATTTIVSSTIFENVNILGRGDAIADAFSPPGSVIVKNSIFASPTQGFGSVCYAGVWASLGHNIAGDASCGFTGTGDMNSTKPQLGALANNGGPTQTHAPLLGSPAIDTVPLADCTDTNANPITTDQRGVTRPQGTACDIGSVELGVGPELFWGTPVTPGTATGKPNFVWFDSDGIPGPAPVAATPAIPIPYGTWTSEGGEWWMDAVQAPGQPAVLLVLTSGYGGALRAFRTDGANLTPCGSYSLPALNNDENGGIRVAPSGEFALVTLGNHPNTIGINGLLKFPLNLAATGSCLTGGPTQIPISSQTMIRNVDFHPLSSQQAVISGYSNSVTFVNPISGATLCDVPLDRNTRNEARYRPDGTEVWVSSYDGHQIAVITPPGLAGACTVSKFIATGFASNDGLSGGSFHSDPNVPVYYVISYPGGNIFAVNTNTKLIASSIHVATPAMTAVTRGPANLLEVPIYGCCPQYSRTNTYDVSTISKAENFAANLIGTHASTVDMQTVATLRNVALPAQLATQVTIASSPAGRAVSVSGAGCQPGSYTAPQTLSWTPGSNCTVSFASPQSGTTGTQYGFSNWADDASAPGSRTLATPAAATTYTANFTTQYLLTTAASPSAGGTVSGGGWYNAGTTATVTASPNNGYGFSSWTGATLSGPAAGTILMDGSKTATGNFVTLTPVMVTTSPAGLGFTVDGTPYNTAQNFFWVPGASHTIATNSPQAAGTGTQYLFANWSDGGALSHVVTTPTAPVTYTATFTTQYLLTTAVGTGGAAAGSITPASGWYDAGTVVVVSATASAGYAFTGFSGDLTGTASPQSLTLTAAKSVTANFVALTPVTVTSTPAGRSFTVDGVTYTASRLFQWVPGSTHTVAISSPQAGAPGTQYVFANWSDGGAISHSVTTSGTALTYTVNFKTQYLLTTVASPGTQGSISPASGYVDAGSTVTVSATAKPTFVFAGFSGGLSGTTTPQNLIVSAPVTVTANFVTPQGWIALMIAQVQELVDAGTLKNDAGLKAKLNGLISELDQGHTGPACNELSAFINEINGLINSGKLTAPQGQALIAAANAVKTAIGC